MTILYKEIFSLYYGQVILLIDMAVVNVILKSYDCRVDCNLGNALFW